MKNIKIILTLIIIIVFPIKIQAHPLGKFIFYNTPLVFIAILLAGILKFFILKTKYPIKNKLIKKLILTGCLEIFCTGIAIIVSGLPILFWDGEFSYIVLILCYLFLGGYVNQYLLSGAEIKLALLKKYFLSIMLTMLYLISISVIYTIFSIF